MTPQELHDHVIKTTEEDKFKDKALVDLYGGLLEELKKENYTFCEEFITITLNNSLDIDRLVHMLNVISPSQRHIKNWRQLVDRSREFFLQERGEEEAKKLLMVIIPTRNEVREVFEEMEVFLVNGEYKKAAEELRKVNLESHPKTLISYLSITNPWKEEPEIKEVRDKIFEATEKWLLPDVGPKRTENILKGLR